MLAEERRVADVHQQAEHPRHADADVAGLLDAPVQQQQREEIRAQREGKPRAKMHPDDMRGLGLANGDRIEMGNERGTIRLAAETFPGIQRGVVVVEGIHPNDDYEDGAGINTLTSAQRIAPYGGAAFHDNHVWIRRLPPA